MDFKPLSKNVWVYINTGKDAVITLYVDDSIITASTKHGVNDIKKHLPNIFNPKKLDQVI
jgi:hypothetical protein